ncbi:MAG TPA: peptidoglycan-binding domain-containing protein [Pyrinomonadaceae bacterium]|nr:peptidoglycan-binding domain-containing protein [Pyrinomonadaceae bacterium]
MAKKQLLVPRGRLTLVERRECKYIWGIDESVSWWRYCLYDDVLLIQYLLNRSGCLTELLVQDGKFGKKTYGAIKKFQRDSHFCHVDGIVDTYKGRSLSMLSNTLYTILALNDALLLNHPRFYKDLSADKYCPSELTGLSKAAIEV